VALQDVELSVIHLHLRLLGCGFAVEEEEVGVNASPARTALGVDLNLLGAKNETGRPKAERAGANESRCRSEGAARCERRLV
jgi:hypothetical protein